MVKMCAAGPTGTGHEKLKHTLPLRGTDYIHCSPQLLQNQTDNRKVKTHLLGGEGRSLMCWFLSSDHNLKK
jgi:hypothetical protein